MLFDQVKSYIDELSSFPTVPFMIGKIGGLKNNENSNDFENLYNIISHDQAIAERVLKIANSPFFGHSGEIDNLRQAIMFLGFENIKNIALSMKIFNYFSKKSKISLYHFWAHAYEVGLISAKISEKFYFKEGNIFLMGLLHDIGRLLFLTIDAKKYLDFFNDKDLLKKEKNLFDCDHCLAGFLVAEKSYLPDEFKIVIKYHHNPLSAKEYKTESIIVATAENLLCRLKQRYGCDGTASDEELIGMIEELGLSDTDIDEIINYYLVNRESLEYFYK